jgi:hypothetical protein
LLGYFPKPLHLKFLFLFVSNYFNHFTLVYQVTGFQRRQIGFGSNGPWETALIVINRHSAPLVV